MLNKFLYILTALFALQGCSFKQEKSINLNILDVELSDLKEIPTRDEISNISNYFQPLFSNNIYFIDSKSKNFLKLDVLNSELLLIGKMEDFLPDFERFSVNEQLEEIYVTEGEYIKAYDFHGNFKWRYEFQYYDKGYVVLMSYNNIPIVENDIIYGHYVKDNDESFKDSNFFKSPIQIEINRKDKKVKFSKVYYPASYSTHCFGMNYQPDRVQLDKNKHLFAFPNSDTAYVYNTATEEVEAYYFGAYEEHEFEYLSYHELKDLNKSAFDDQFFNAPKYVFTKAAPLAGYNFRRLAIKDENTKKHTFKLIVYDKDLNYVGESNYGFESFIHIDTEQGLHSLRLNPEKKCLEVHRVSW